MQRSSPTWWQRLKKGEVRFAVEDPDHPANFPRVLFLWRANLLGASSKGHEYFLKHLLGTDSAVLNTESPPRPQEITWRERAPEGKLDLLVTLEIRMSTSAMYADVALPAAGWYEMHDINTTDMHPFIHPFNPAIDPPWEARTNWDQFKTIAAEVLRARRRAPEGGQGPGGDPAPARQPRRTRPGRGQRLAQGRVRARARQDHAEPLRRVPGLCQRLQHDDGPGAACRQAGGGLQGDDVDGGGGVAELKEKLGTVAAPGVGQGLPSLATGKQVAETILMLSPETNGAVAMKSWGPLEKKTGLSLSHLSAARKSEKFSFDDLTAQPRKIITSPVWSGIESEQRRYSPFVINIEEKVPFRTLTGRAHFYLDHPWMRDFGEGLPLFRPPVDMSALGSTDVKRDARKELVLNYLTPHSKWSIHSTYSDTLTMLTLFRGGEAIWINNDDAATLGVKDGDWLECFNVNGVVMAKAVVSHRIPPGKAFMYHAQERLINTPGAPLSGKRGGTHNSVTRIMVKPTHMIGGYAQLSYGFNYYGPVGSQRDEVIVVRKAGEVEWHED